MGYASKQLRTIAEFQYRGLSETALFSPDSCLRSAVQGRNPNATNPRKGKTLKSPPIGGFSNSRAEPTNEESRAGFLTGVCVARRLRIRKPGLRIILLSSAAGGEAEEWAHDNSVIFLRKDEGRNRLLQHLQQIGLSVARKTFRAFIVHGHDEQSLMQLKDYLQNTLQWQEPIILRDHPSAGKTIIEKFEEYASGIDCVFVLLTPDDVAITTGSNDGSGARGRMSSLRWASSAALSGGAPGA